MDHSVALLLVAFVRVNAQNGGWLVEAADENARLLHVKPRGNLIPAPDSMPWP
jgi:hypothetical protein